jgi:hypothetical protein
VKEPNKKKPATGKAAAAAKKATDTTVIRLDDLVAKTNVRGGRKTFFGGK